MKIRKAVPGDAPSIAKLTTELGYVADVPAVAERLSSLSDRDDDLVLVAEESGEVAGWIQAHTSVVLESGHRMEIVGLIVSGRFRRQGVGRSLVESAESWGRERGVAVFTVRSNIVREESHEFYPALGYEKSKTQAVYRKKLKTEPNQALQTTPITRSEI
jgi:ribosomal protein S18 acetylase RimI-like enzyme